MLLAQNRWLIGAEKIQDYLEMCGIGLCDDFSGIGLLGGKAWAEDGWRNTLKSPKVLLGCIKNSASKTDYKGKGSIALPKLIDSNF